LSFVRMRISCVYRTNSRELKIESQWNASATTILFRITTLTLDNFQTASGLIWRVSKETTPTSLRARVLARCRKWISQEFNKGPRRRNNRILNLHTSRRGKSLLDRLYALVCARLLLRRRQTHIFDGRLKEPRGV